MFAVLARLLLCTVRDLPRIGSDSHRGTFLPTCQIHDAAERTRVTAVVPVGLHVLSALPVRAPQL